MKRRSKVKRKRARCAKFSFAQLEPRKLLAADGLFASSMGADFIGPVFAETMDPVCVLQSEDVASEAVETENAKQEESQSKVETETCSDAQPKEIQPEEIEGLDSELPTDSPGVISRNSINRTFIEAGLSNKFDGSGAIGVLNDGQETTATMTRLQINDAGQVDSYAYNGRAGATFIIIYNDPADSAPLEKPVELEPEETFYFQETTQESEPETANVGNVRSIESESSANVGMLAQRQLFALISPTEIGGVDVQGSAAAKVAQPVSDLQPLATVQSGSVAGKVQGNSFSNTGSPIQGPQSLPPLRVTMPLEMKVRPASAVAPISSHPMDGLVERAVSRAPAILPYTVLDRLFEGRKATGQAPANNDPSADPAPTNDESASDDGLARSVQIVESAIVLIGLPSSRVCRDNESRDRSRV